MNKLVGFLSLFLIFSLSANAQNKLPKVEFSLDNPIVKKLIIKTLDVYIPKVTGEDKKVKDIYFITKKETDEFVNVKGTVVFRNQAAALGNGNYRFKLKVNKNLLKPKIHFLKLQAFRIFFIRFYRKVIG